MKLSLSIPFCIMASMKSVADGYGIKAGVHHCVHITRKMAKNGDGSTPTSCMSCDPTIPTCSTGCQRMIDQMYRVCDDVCLPYNYYYDANYRIDGCWHEVQRKIKIAVERCGCNNASSVSLWSSLFVLLIITVILVMP